MSFYYYDTEFWERPGRIDLISIGIIDENGRKYYAENSEFDWDACDLQWLHENVRPHLLGGVTSMPLSSIKEGILEFVDDGYEHPEFRGWFSAYDHVVFCMIFGSMVDLPNGWPMITHDLVQHMEGTGIPRQALPRHVGVEHNALDDAIWTKKAWEFVDSHKAYR